MQILEINKQINYLDKVKETNKGAIKVLNLISLINLIAIIISLKLNQIYLPIQVVALIYLVIRAIIIIINSSNKKHCFPTNNRIRHNNSPNHNNSSNKDSNNSSLLKINNNNQICFNKPTMAISLNPQTYSEALNNNNNQIIYLINKIQMLKLKAILSSKNLLPLYN